MPPERFGLLQALLAYLLDRCGDNNEAVIPASDITERFNIPPESLEEHLQLLNLVNFGGGCYAVYTELQDGRVYVEKELFGDTFRSPPRLTPLEARAIRLALEFVGPMIAADAHTPLERVRRKLEETFGEFDLGQAAQPQGARAEEKLVGTLSDGVRRQRLVEIEYQKEGEETLSTRLVEPYVIDRQLPYWYVHTWDRTRDAQRSFRLDRMRSAKLQRETFEPREGFRPDRLSSAAVAARIWYSKRIGRWKGEEGARPLSDGAALAEKAVGSEEWLVGEILGDRGEAVLLEPENLRKQVASRAKALARELKVSRVAVGDKGPYASRGGRVDDGQDEREGRALGGHRMHLQRAAVGLRDRPGNEEPEACSRLGVLSADAAELLEDERLVLGCDAGAAVAHLDRDPAVLREGLDVDRRAGRRVLDRVVDQVRDHLPQPPPVRAHERQRRIDARVDRHLVLAALGERCRFTDQLPDVDVRERVAEAPGLDAGGVEDVADEICEALRLVLDQRRGRTHAGPA